MSQQRLAMRLRLWTVSGCRGSGTPCLFSLACTEILITHMANPAMLVFILSITGGPQVHSSSCKLRQQWLAKPRLCIISSSRPSGQCEKLPAARCVSQLVSLEPWWEELQTPVCFAHTANTKTRSKANTKTLPPIWLVGVFLPVVN